MMLGNKNVAANVAVKDIDVAKRFYADTLGLEQVGAEGDEMLEMKSGDTVLNIYKSDYAGTNKATALTWEVDDVRKTVEELKGKGVSFEHYDELGMARDGDIHDGGDYKIAWFKDPDGNILNIVG